MKGRVSRNMAVLRTAAAVLLLLSPVLAQNRQSPRRAPRAKSAPVVVADANQAYPLASIEVKGAAALDAASIIELSGLKAGAPVRKADFDEAQQKLLATGLFETVAYRFQPVPGGNSYSATLEVKEIAQLFPYRFEAIDVDAKQLRAWLLNRCSGVWERP